jgi:transposase-like protein
MGTMARYTNEMRERAVLMVAEVRPEHPHETAALRHVAGLLGMNVETLRLWRSSASSARLLSFAGQMRS